MKIKFDKNPTSPNEINNLKVNYGPSKRPISKWRFRIVLLIFLSPFLLFALYVAKNTIFSLIYVNAPGYVILSQTTIKAPYDGKVIYTKPQGSNVAKNEIIAILSNQLVENEYKELLKGINELKENSNPQVQGDKYLINTAKSLYEYRLKVYKEIYHLREIGAATQAEVANALSQLESASIAYKQYENNLKTKKNPNIPISDELELSKTKSILQSLTIRSPQNATVASVITKEGELVNKNDDIMVLQDNHSPKIIAFFRPKDGSYLIVGRKAKVVFPSGQFLYANITSIKMQTQRLPSDLTTPFKDEKLSLVVELEPINKIPNNLKVNYLPVKVILKPLIF